MAKSQPASAVASVAALPEGGWRPQERLHQGNLAGDCICRACNVATGTLLHRCALCEAKKEWRDAECPTWLRKNAVEHPLDPLFCQGVPRRPLCTSPAQESVQWLGAVPTDGPIARGQAYTDGALRGSFSRAKRAGWAFIVSDGQAQLWGKSGSLAEHYPSVVRSELRALLEILRHTVGGIVVHVDNQEVVDGVHLGRAWCCVAGRDGADLWRSIWHILDDLSEVEVVKVQAHLKISKVLGGTIDCAHWVVNAIADVWAKAGCAAASRAAPCDHVHKQWTRAVSWYKWLVRMAVEWKSDVATSAPLLPPSTVHPAQQRGSLHSEPNRRIRGNVHELWRNSHHAWCRKCGISAQVVRSWPPIALCRACRGTMGTLQHCRPRGCQATPHPAARRWGPVLCDVSG